MWGQFTGVIGSPRGVASDLSGRRTFLGAHSDPRTSTELKPDYIGGPVWQTGRV